MILLLDENLMGSIYTDPQTCELQDGIFGSDDWPTVAKTSSDESHVDNYEAPNFNARLKRGFDENYNLDTDPSTVAYYITAYPGFKQFSGWIEGRPHGICHLFLSFSMSIMFSPDDPCFWLHHTNIDRLYHWWADCWDYENVITPGPNQYTAANPINSNSNTAYNPYTGVLYNVAATAKFLTTSLRTKNLTYFRIQLLAQLLLAGRPPINCGLWEPLLLLVMMESIIVMDLMLCARTIPLDKVAKITSKDGIGLINLIPRKDLLMKKLLEAQILILN